MNVKLTGMGLEVGTLVGLFVGTLVGLLVGLMLGEEVMGAAVVGEAVGHFFLKGKPTHPLLHVS